MTLQVYFNGKELKSLNFVNLNDDEITLTTEDPKELGKEGIIKIDPGYSGCFVRDVVLKSKKALKNSVKFIYTIKREVE